VHAGFTWDVPERFNFTRDVVEPLAADPYRRALTFVDRTGLVERITFAELATDAARWAHLLRTRGYGQGDRVLVMLGKVPAWLGVMLGAIKAGLVTVPCSEMLRSRDIAFRARNSGARLVVADPAFQPELDAARSLVDDPLDVLYLDDAQLLLRRQPLTAETEETLWCDEAMILYTSGTTKDPKGATHAHAYLFATRMQAEHWLDARPGDLVWCTAGTGWAKSIWNVLVGPWSRGAEIVLHDGAFDGAERLALLESLEVTILCQAPTEYRLLAKLDELGTRPLPALRHAVSAGEPLNPEVIARFRDALGVTIYDGYGQTENTLLVANTPERAVRPGSMGWPTPGHRVAVIDEEGHEVADGVEGDIALHGRPPSLFMRYWNAPNETGDVFRGDWYVTGDRASRDEDGSIWFTGRADDVILSAAYRIGPFEVESALLEHPAVAESAVVGKPDPERGQIVKAFVVLRAGHKPTRSLVKELQSHAKRITAPYKYPREIEFVAELPKTASGKIRRVELRDAGAASGAATAAVAQPEPLRETAVAAETAPPAELEPETVAGTTETANEAADEFLREAAERRRAEEDRQQSAAEAQRAHDAERERSQREFEQAERVRYAQRQRVAEDAARAAAEHAERRRREDEGREALAEAEQRRRSEQRRVDEQQAVERRRRSWLAAASDDQGAAAASVTQLSSRGSGPSGKDDPGGGRAA
jgi:acyl-coenzyme A synthetase/AMP-(fatty) acid ligase